MSAQRSRAMPVLAALLVAVPLARADAATEGHYRLEDFSRIASVLHVSASLRQTASLLSCQKRRHGANDAARRFGTSPRLATGNRERPASHMHRAERSAYGRS